MSAKKPLRLILAALLASLPLFSAADTPAGPPLSDADVRAVVQAISKGLVDSYPFPDLSKRYADALAQAVAAKHYAGLDACAFAKSVTADLQAAHKDVHLHVFCRKPAPGAKPGHTQEPPRKEFGVEAVELDNELSTAYIRSTHGWDQDQDSYDMVASAMNLAAHSKYVIIDVRDNPGGSGTVGRLFGSYFYPAGDEEFYLNGFHKDRSIDEQEWTYVYVPGRRIPDAKLYILVNAHTASAAEGFAYAMQKLKRATIIGQTTAGAGIAGEFIELGHSLRMFLPTKMVVAPHTLVGWEGTGVVPDVATPAGGEREAALGLIRQAAAKAAPKR